MPNPQHQELGPNVTRTIEIATNHTGMGADPSGDPTPKGGVTCPLYGPKLLHGTMCFVGARGARDVG